MWVEVEFLNAEWGRYFSFVVNVSRVEKLGSSVILEHIASLGVSEVTSDVCGMARLVPIVPLTILKDNDVASFVPIELSKNVVDVESSVVGIRWHFHWVGWLVEVLNQLLRHHNFSLKCLIFLFDILLRNNISRHLGSILDSSGLLFQPSSFFLLPLCLFFSVSATLLFLKGCTLLPELLLLFELLCLLE